MSLVKLSELIFVDSLWGAEENKVIAEMYDR
jgi:hypothetical protein